MRATNQTLTAAVRGGLIAGRETSFLLSISNGQFIEGHRAA
jgi:hypothetical protein